MVVVVQYATEFAYFKTSLLQVYLRDGEGSNPEELPTSSRISSHTSLPVCKIFHVSIVAFEIDSSDPVLTVS
ncbi:hypothetical protein TELCIR_12023 [Teladorsagia circumcincta]|uniref:Uncharacterized protein n=1 Tax=Teladorsagia circumcincta TaxID=45464 RepID=A0A2G9U7M3_TELCI|nr:hypothetical protein TELCIR_12023 [Teladorsagia circumcincta]